MSVSMAPIDSERDELLTREVCFLPGLEEGNNVLQPNATDDHDPIPDEHVPFSNSPRNLQATEQKYSCDSNLLRPRYLNL